MRALLSGGGDRQDIIDIVALRLLSIEIMVRQSYYEIEFEFIDRNSTIVVHKSLVSSRLEKKNNRRRIGRTTLLLIPVRGYLVE